MANQKLVIVTSAVLIDGETLNLENEELNALLADGWRIVESSITSHGIIGDTARVSTLLRLER